MIELYTYFRSSASYRVRIALNLKKLNYQNHYVNLKTGEQCQPDFAKLNPQKLVPVCVIDKKTITQSLAIIEYLDEIYPDNKLLPDDAFLKAQAQSIAYSIACEIQPFGNVKTLKYLKDNFAASDDQIKAWAADWIKNGFNSLEKQITELFPKTTFCCSNLPTLADICLVPQVYNALRFGVDMHQFPRIMAIYQACNQLSAFQKAAPEVQDDYQV
jgi:maleylpyruvate isomerase